jgi:hypothetical protein
MPRLTPFGSFAYTLAVMRKARFKGMSAASSGNYKSRGLGKGELKRSVPPLRFLEALSL